TLAGSARWHGRIYDSFAPSLARQRVYRGPFGSAAYQSVYHAPGHALDIAHQLGVPACVALILASPLGLLVPAFLPIPLAALLTLVVLGVTDAFRTTPPRHLADGRLTFRAMVALLH